MLEPVLELVRGSPGQAHEVRAWSPAGAAVGEAGPPQAFPAQLDADRADRSAAVLARLGGDPVALARFRPCRHPSGLAGSCVEVALQLAPDAAGCGPAVLALLEDHLRGEGVDAAVCAPPPAEDAPLLGLLKAAGWQPSGPGFAKELASTLWRRGRLLVVAEAGSNWRMGHGRRDLAMGRALIEIAAAAGADAVKFQTYRAASLYAVGAGRSDYLAASGIDEPVDAVLADLEMPYEMLADLAAHARGQGIRFMSTGFSAQDFAAIDPHVEVHKIASYEISHPRLIDLAARSGKPLILSTGAAEEEDIAWAVERFHAQGGRDLCLMQCTASYPAPLASLDLAALPWLRRRFGVAVGLSDHSRDPLTAPVAAVALGARCIEKHFTLHNALPGPDHAFALTPAELETMVRHVRAAEEARGEGFKAVRPVEAELATFARRGIQAMRDIAPGEPLREGDTIAILRPGRQPPGLHPRHLDALEGRPATRAIPAGAGIEAGDWA